MTDHERVPQVDERALEESDEAKAERYLDTPLSMVDVEELKAVLAMTETSDRLTDMVSLTRLGVERLVKFLPAYLSPVEARPAQEPVTRVVSVPLDDLLFAYRGLLVLLTMCKRAHLKGGSDATREILTRLETIEPALPSLSALREQMK